MLQQFSPQRTLPSKHFPVVNLKRTQRPLHMGPKRPIIYFDQAVDPSGIVHMVLAL